MIQKQQHGQIDDTFVQEGHKGGIGSFSRGLQKGLTELVKAIEGACGEGGVYKNPAVGDNPCVVHKDGNHLIAEKEAEQGENAARHKIEIPVFRRRPSSRFLSPLPQA